MAPGGMEPGSDDRLSTDRNERGDSLTPPLRVKLFVGLTGCSGAATIIVAGYAARHDPFPRPGLFIAFVLALAATWAFPLLLFRNKETESLQLDEALLVAMALLLPPTDVVFAYTIGVLLGQLARRRGTIKVIFNTGQSTTSVGLAMLAAYVVGPVKAPISLNDALAVVAGAGVFVLVQNLAVSAVISIAEQRSFRITMLEGLAVKSIVWIGNVSAGLLAGLVSLAYPWALGLAVIPIAMLQFAFSGHLRALRDRERMNGLLRASMNVHFPAEIDEVRVAISESAKELLRSNSALFTSQKPEPRADTLSVRIGTNSESKWLVVSGRMSIEQFDESDQSMLEAVAAIGSAALEKAELYREVAEHRRNLAEVLDSSFDGIFAVDADESITLWSPSMERITGYPARGMIGTQHLAALRPRDSEGRDVMTSGWAMQPNSLPEILQIVTSTGEVRWLSCVFSPMPAGGQVVIARDVTSQKEIDDLKADFLGTISHELRTPLTPIQGFLQTLLKAGKRFNDSERERFYEIMLAQSERLGSLVDQILDAVSLSSSEKIVAPERVDWSGSVKGIVELMQRQYPQRSFIFPSESYPAVYADAGRAEQVLTNLLANAVKYSYPDTPVRIDVKHTDGVVITTVSDIGPGVASSDRERIFERFTRLGDHLTRKVGGVGLGLYISRRLVEAMNGKIWVEDSSEGGAAFSFSLPAYEGPRLVLVNEQSA